jgi:sulfate permease, SulP family
LMTALILFICWLFRLGFVANFLSKAVLIGFISGLGVEVLTSQIQKIMGIHVEADHWLVEVWEMIKSIPQANIYCVIIGVGAIILIRVIKRFAPKVPGALVALVLATIAVPVFGLDQLGVSVLGEIPTGLPALHIPQIGLTDYFSLLPGALAIAGITIAEGLLIARKFADKYGDKIDRDEELFAFGAANLVTGLTGGLVVGSSASRTAAMDGSGMRSQIPSIVGGVVVALVLMFFADLLALVPNAVLAGIVANAVLALIEVGELRALYVLRRSEFWIAIVCMASVLAAGPLIAVLLAFTLSTIDIVRRAADPLTNVMRPLPDGRGYTPSRDLENPMIVPGLVLFRLGARLFFANANVFRERVKDVTEAAGPSLKWFVLDAEAVNDIDMTGAEALEHVIDDFAGRGITFALSRAEPPIPDLLKVYGLLEKIGEQRLYITNRDAVNAYIAETGQHLVDIVPSELVVPAPGMEPSSD